MRAWGWMRAARASAGWERRGGMALRGVAAAWLLGAAMGLAGCTLSQDRTDDAAPARDVSAALAGADTAGHARARAVRVFAFPGDHGPHEEFKTEWWYFTGTLATREGRRFGYQLTFFRDAFAPAAGTAPSEGWRTRQTGFAHFAVSDIDGRGFHPFERFSRWGAGLAGAEAAPFRVWLDDWRVVDSAGVWRLHAREGDVALVLDLVAERAPVLQGDRGLSRKSAGEGNASYYYSITRLASRGTVEIGGVRHAVAGTTWLDREWSTSVLLPTQQGWDWFSLRLDDGRDLMLFQLRLKDGGVDAYSAGSVVDASGRVRALSSAEFSIEALEWWTSGRTGVKYPVRWRVRVPSAGIDGEVRAMQRDQELPLTIRYWEGAVGFAGRGVRGEGYAELTGYE